MKKGVTRAAWNFVAVKAMRLSMDMLTGYVSENLVKTNRETDLLFNKCRKSIKASFLLDKGTTAHHDDCAEFKLNVRHQRR